MFTTAWSGNAVVVVADLMISRNSGAVAWTPRRPSLCTRTTPYYYASVDISIEFYMCCYFGIMADLSSLISEKILLSSHG